MRRRTFLELGLIAAAAAGGYGAGDFRRTMNEARQNIALAGPALTVETRHGPMEYALAGEGQPLLMIHGTGGGYDQGLLFGRRLAQNGFRIIAPSRFGYLGTPFPDDPGPEAQADALVDLLDHLGLTRVAVAGGSAGALPALAFALRYPERTAALVPIVPASFVPGRPPAKPPTAFASWMIEHGLRSDFLVWAALRLSEDRMIATLLATDPALVHAATADEQARVRAILYGILPVGLRYDGLLNDAYWVGNSPDWPLGTIRAPTLAVSAVDDRYGTAEAARHIVASVPGAELLLLKDGGHVMVGHDAEVMARIADFLRNKV